MQLARVLAQIWPDSENEKNQLRYLLLDECTSALDPAHQHQVLEVVRQFTQPSLITCAVMHDLNLASQYADRILLMKDGRIVSDGTPKHVLSEENLAHAYSVKARVIHHSDFTHPLIISTGSNL